MGIIEIFVLITIVVISILSPTIEGAYEPPEWLKNGPYPSWILKSLNNMTASELSEAAVAAGDIYDRCKPNPDDADCMKFVIRMNMLCAFTSMGPRDKWSDFCDVVVS
jgi:hypothetical protein